jgi:AcrR family transcriptional regulator
VPRRDALDNRGTLLTAVAALLAEQGPGFTLTAVAQRADLSTATAYRHFPRPDEAIDAYFATLTKGLIEAFDALDPHAGIEEVCAEWVKQAANWGPAAVYLRSPHGFLQRLNDGDDFIRALYDHLQRHLNAAILAGEIPGQDIRYAALIWVTIFDERVVVDLTVTEGLTVERATERLTGTLLAVLRKPAGSAGHLGCL